MTSTSVPLFPAPSATSPATATLLDIESLLGFRPRASLALYVRRRRRPPAALRVDLPPDAPGDPQEFARALTGLLARVSGAISAELVVYGRDSDTRAAIGRVVPLLQSVHTRFSAAGFDVPRLLLVVAGHWAEPPVGALVQTGRSPRGMRWSPLPGTAPREAGVAGVGEPPAADPHHGVFVPVAPASTRRRERAMAALAVLTQTSGSGAGAAAPEPGDVAELLLHWNAVLSAARPGIGPPGALPSDAVAVALLWSLPHRIVRDCVLMMCAWGLDAGAVALYEATEPDGATIGSGAVYDTFLGMGATAPDPLAVRTAVDLLRHLVSCGPDSLAAPAYTMLGWLEWARGRGSVADAYLEACRRVDSDYRLARLLRMAIRHGFMPEWA